MALCMNIVCLLSVMLLPYMPHASSEIQKQLNVSAVYNGCGLFGYTANTVPLQLC